MVRSRAESRLRVTAAVYALPGGMKVIGATRTAVGTACDAIDAVRGRQRPDLTPPRRLGFVGGGDFHATGREFLAYFRELGQLETTDDVLDIGCGIGRMAVPLTGYLGEKSRYAGFDVVPDGIGWCQRNITPRFPNFQFRTIDAFNERYNRGGSSESRAYRFPYDAETFDFVFATSVFTHLLPDVMKNYVREASRVLRPGGRFFATFFLTPSRKPVAPEAEPIISFHHGGSGYRAVTRRTPEVAVGYDEADVTKAIEQSGMQIRETRYGAWSGGAGLTYQDVLVASKE